MSGINDMGMNVSDVGNIGKEWQRGQQQLSEIMMIQRQLNLKMDILTSALDLYNYQKYTKENSLSEEKLSQQGFTERAAQLQGSLIGGGAKKTTGAQRETGAEETPEETRVSKRAGEKEVEEGSIFAGAAQKWGPAHKPAPFGKMEEEQGAFVGEGSKGHKGAHKGEKGEKAPRYGEEAEGMPAGVGGKHKAEKAGKTGAYEGPEETEEEGFEGGTKAPGRKPPKVYTGTEGLRFKEPPFTKEKAEKGEKAEAEAKTGGKVGAGATTGAGKKAAAPSSSYQPGEPHWKSDPLGSVMGMIDWLMADDILPAAYSQLSAFARLASLHNKQANFLESLERELQSLAGLKSVPLKSPPPSITSTRGKAIYLVKELYRELGPLVKIFSQLSNKTMFTKNDPEYSAWKQIQKKLGSNFDKGHLRYIEDWAKHIGSEYHHIKYSPSKFNQFTWGVIKVTTAGGDTKYLVVQGFLKYLNSSYLHQVPKTAGGQTNPHWHYAFNNLGNTGAWNLPVGFITQALSSLSNESENDQQNLRTSFFSLTTKVNAASDMLTTLGQMMQQVAQNSKTQ